MRSRCLLGLSLIVDGRCSVRVISIHVCCSSSFALFSHCSLIIVLHLVAVLSSSTAFVGHTVSEFCA